MSDEWLLIINHWIMCHFGCLQIILWLWSSWLHICLRRGPQHQFIYWCINTLQQLSDTLPSKYLNYILFSTEQYINWLVDVLGWLKKRLITSTGIKIITFRYFIVNYCEMCQLGYLKIIWLWSRWLYACLFEKSTALSVPLRYLFMTLSIPCNTVRWINYLQPH